MRWYVEVLYSQFDDVRDNKKDDVEYTTPLLEGIG